MYSGGGGDPKIVLNFFFKTDGGNIGKLNLFLTNLFCNNNDCMIPMQEDVIQYIGIIYIQFLLYTIEF